MWLWKANSLRGDPSDGACENRPVHQEVRRRANINKNTMTKIFKRPPSGGGYLEANRRGAERELGESQDGHVLKQSGAEPDDRSRTMISPTKSWTSWRRSVGWWRIGRGTIRMKSGASAYLFNEKKSRF